MERDNDDKVDEERVSKWAAIEKLPTVKRMKLSLFDENGGEKTQGTTTRVVDVTKLGALERHEFIEKLIKNIEHDNLHLLQRIRNRIDR